MTAPQLFHSFSPGLSQLCYCSSQKADGCGPSHFGLCSPTSLWSQTKVPKFNSQATWCVGHLGRVGLLCSRGVMDGGVLTLCPPRRAWLCSRQSVFFSVWRSIWRPFFSPSTVPLYQQLCVCLCNSSSLTPPPLNGKNRKKCHLWKFSSLGLGEGRCSSATHVPPASYLLVNVSPQILVSHSFDEWFQGLLPQPCWVLCSGDMKMTQVCCSLCSFISHQQVEGVATLGPEHHPFMKRALDQKVEDTDKKVDSMVVSDVLRPRRGLGQLFSLHSPL